LLKDVLDILAKNNEIKIIKVWDDRPEDVFLNYELNVNRDLLMYPFGAFRIQIELSYYYEC